MTGLLLDTNAAIWLLSDPARLGPESARRLNTAPVWVSAVSLWEIEIKQAIGKVSVADNIGDSLRASGVRELVVPWAHTRRYSSIALQHRDPFDRMLIAQSESEGFDFLTADRVLLTAGLPFVFDARL